MSGPEQKSPARGGKKWIVLAATALLLAGGGWVVLQRRGHTPEPALKKPVAFEPGVLELEPFVLNLVDPAGDRYCRIALRLVLDQRAVAERAADGLAQVKLRDRILAVLSRKRAGELTSTEGKERLRAEILAASEALLGEPPFHDAARDTAPARVVDVLFTEFLVQ